MTERWFDGRAALGVLMSAAAVLLLLHGLGSHAPGPLGVAGALPAEAVLRVAPVPPPADAPSPASDQDGCPKQGEQSGESGWVKPPPPPCRDGGRRAHRRDLPAEAAVAAGARGGPPARTCAGRRNGPRLPVFRC
ncbi:hypothetical protein [Sphaerisporangium aureirubrum]|uniref:Uncharacterized protein n=1 Tax=Sphaerisporangium aureirubrum TaxID=1544736 RepID=A0ABW1NMI3_9ACTN